LSDQDFHSDACLSLAAKERIDQLCVEFEDRWQRESAVDMTPFLERIEPAAQGVLFRELVVLDASYRRLRELPCDRAYYEQHFPERSYDVQCAFAKLTELDTISDLPSGTKLGRYEIEAKIGSGGFATVYRAFDHELQRHVAIKSLRRDRGTPPANLPHLMDEARTVARLLHPAIVPLHDVLQVDGNT
jgi:hypothetical protein